MWSRSKPRMRSPCRCARLWAWALLSVMTVAASGAPLGVYSFTTASGDEATFPVDAQPANGTFSVMSRGSGLTPNAGTNTFSATAWATGALDTSDYFEFTLSPAGGFSLTLTNLNFDERRSSTGIRSWAVRSSLDSFAANVATGAVPDDTSTRSQSVLLGAGFSGQAAGVTFRFYGFAAEASGGSWRLDNVALYGSIAASGSPATNVQFTASSASVGEAAGAYTVTVYKSLASGDVAGSVGLGGGASEGGGNDYTVDTTNFTLNGSTTSATFVVTVNDDGLVESPETVVLTLANVTGGTVVSPSVFTLTINDNDGGGTPPVLAAIGNKTTRTNVAVNFVVSATLTEGDAVTLTASNVPGGATFFPTNESGSFYWASPAPAGVYTVGFYAVDNDGVDSESITITVTNTPPSGPVLPNVWINELHYDTKGQDDNEGVELAGTAGIDLSLLTVYLYSGPQGNVVYSNRTITGTIPNESNGIGAVWYEFTNDTHTALENGPDGIAVVQGSTVIQFLSYEGVITAANGPAAGQTSVDIGVRENSSDSGTNTATPYNWAVQLCGTGTNYAGFAWSTNRPHSRGFLNACQTIPSGGGGGGDTDGDGMSDEWETTYFGTLTNEPSGDVDGDGFLNGQELIAFSNPADSNSFLRVIGTTNAAGMQVVFPSVTGRQYRLLGSPLLPAQAWTSIVAGPVSGTGGALALGVGGSETTGAVRLSVEMP